MQLSIPKQNIHYMPKSLWTPDQDTLVLLQTVAPNKAGSTQTWFSTTKQGP